MNQPLDNTFLARMVATARQERDSGLARTDPALVAKHDWMRRLLVLQDHQNGLIVTAADFENAAAIFRRSTTPEDIEHARAFAQQALNLRMRRPR